MAKEVVFENNFQRGSTKKVDEPSITETDEDDEEEENFESVEESFVYDDDESL